MAEVDFTKDVTVESNGGTGNFSNDVSESSKKPTEPNEDRKLFIGGLSWETRDNHLKEYFTKFGEVEKVELKLNPMTGKSRCFAFVLFSESSSVQKVLEAGEHAINSKKVDVKRAKGRTGKLFVGGLKTEMTDDEIRAAFEKFGTVVEFEMPMDRAKKIRKGFGFVTFEREETMKELLKKGKVEIGQHMVDLRKATPRQEMMQMQQPQFYGNGGYAYGGYQPSGDFYGGGGGGAAAGYGYGGYDYYSGGGWGYGGGGGGGGGSSSSGGYGYGASPGGGKMRGHNRRGRGAGAPY